MAHFVHSFAAHFVLGNIAKYKELDTEDIGAVASSDESEANYKKIIAIRNVHLELTLGASFNNNL